MLSSFVEFNRHLAEVDRLFSLTARTPARPTSAPRFSVTETEQSWVVRGILPGWSAEDIVLEVEDGMLTLKGSAKPTVPEGFVSLHRERPDRSFSRTLRIPEAVDQDQISASTTDGVLTVTLPRKPTAEPRRISVEAA